MTKNLFHFIMLSLLFTNAFAGDGLNLDQPNERPLSEQEVGIEKSKLPPNCRLRYFSDGRHINRCPRGSFVNSVDSFMGSIYLGCGRYSIYCL